MDMLEDTPAIDLAPFVESSDHSTHVAFEDPRNIDFDIDFGTHKSHPSSLKTKASPPKATPSGKAKSMTRRASVFGSFFGSLRPRKTHGLGVREVLRRVSMTDVKLIRSASRGDRNDENADDGGMDDETPKDPVSNTGTHSEAEEEAYQMSMEEALMLPVDDSGRLAPAAEDPFKTPPCTPTTRSLPLSPVTNMSAGSPDSMPGSVKRRKTQRARLMSRMKSVQILGVEASSAVAAKWRSNGWDSR